jgi:hypothetical protein
VEEAGRYTHQAHLEIRHPSAEAGRPDVRSSLQLIGNDSMNLGITQRMVRVEENLKRFTLLSLEKRREKWEKKKKEEKAGQRGSRAFPSSRVPGESPDLQGMTSCICLSWHIVLALYSSKLSTTWTHMLVTSIFVILVMQFIAPQKPTT